jgi:hypothetical protein
LSCRCTQLREHLIFLGSVLVHFVVASGPRALYLQYYALTAATTRCGLRMVIHAEPLA